MTGYKFSDNETIRALKRMSEEDPDGFSSDVLDLISRQKAEIERLEHIRADQSKEIDHLNEDLQAAKAAANPFLMRYAKPLMPMMSIKEIQKNEDVGND